MCDAPSEGVAAGRAVSSLAEQAEDLLRVGRGRLDVLLQPARPVAGLALQSVTEAGLLPHDLSGAGDAEPLLRTAVRLVLRHGCRALLVASAPPRRLGSLSGRPSG